MVSMCNSTKKFNASKEQKIKAKWQKSMAKSLAFGTLTSNSTPVPSFKKQNDQFLQLKQHIDGAKEMWKNGKKLVLLRKSTYVPIHKNGKW